MVKKKTIDSLKSKNDSKSTPVKENPEPRSKRHADAEVCEVGWCNGVPQKYQARVTVYRPDGSIKILTGDPSSLKHQAISNLRHELQERFKDINLSLEMLDKDNIQTFKGLSDEL